MKLIPTSVRVDDLKFYEETNHDTLEKFNKQITGTITINFTTAGDFSMFVQQNENSTRILWLKEFIQYHVINKEIEL